MAKHLDDVALAMLGEHEYVVLASNWPVLSARCSCDRWEILADVHHVVWLSWVAHMRIELNEDATEGGR